MKAILTPGDVLIAQLSNLQDAIFEAAEAMPELCAVASSSELRALLRIQQDDLTAHGDEVRSMIQNREGRHSGGDRHPASFWLDGEGERIGIAHPGPVRDLLIVAQVTRMKHLQIASTRFAASLADCLDLTCESGALWQMQRRHEEVLKELAQVAANFFSPCLLESGRL